MGGETLSSAARFAAYSKQIQTVILLRFTEEQFPSRDDAAPLKRLSDSHSNSASDFTTSLIESNHETNLDFDFGPLQKIVEHFQKLIGKRAKAKYCIRSLTGDEKPPDPN